MNYPPRHWYAIVTLLPAALAVLLVGCPQAPAPATDDDATVGGPASENAIQPGDRVESIGETGDNGDPFDLRTDVALDNGDGPLGGVAPPDSADSKEAIVARTPSEEAIARAIGYILAQQRDDGGIKSDAYGILRPGAATTALALYSIAHAPEESIEPHREALHKAYAFLKSGLNANGKISAPDGTLDYPTYGAAMLLVAARRLNLEMSPDEEQLLTRWIIDAQLTEKHDVAPESIQYGGWDLEAVSGAKGDQLKGTNISITSFALEALHGSMHEDAPAAVRRARDWVRRCQNKDGGFVFHVWRQHPGNKAMWRDNSQAEAISYATPTCDGLRCLMYCGYDAEDEPVAKTLAWLAAHPGVKLVPGFEGKAKEYGWREGLRFYYYFTQAKTLPHLPEIAAKRRAAALRKLLLAEQRPDGSFKNAQPRMFEDDPLLATSLALIALSAVAE